MLRRGVASEYEEACPEADKGTSCAIPSVHDMNARRLTDIDPIDFQVFAVTRGKCQMWKRISRSRAFSSISHPDRGVLNHNQATRVASS